MICKNCDYSREFKDKVLCAKGNFFMSKEDSLFRKCNAFMNRINEFKRKNNFR